MGRGAERALHDARKRGIAALLVVVGMLSANAWLAWAQDPGLIEVGNRRDPSDLRPVHTCPRWSYPNDEIKAIAAFLGSRQ